MGIQIIDSISVPLLGISLTNIVQTIKGCYNIQKDYQGLYNVRILLYWYVSSEATSPIYQEEKIIQFDTVADLDIYTEVYNRLKTAYVSTVGI